MSGNKRKILNISLPVSLFAEIEKLAKKEAKTKAEFTRDVLRKYVERNKRWEQIRAWGEETAGRLEIKKEEDIEEIVHQLRGVDN